MRLIFTREEGEISDAICKATNSEWSHVGVLMNNKRFMDFSHTDKIIRNVDELVMPYEVVHTPIDRGQLDYHLYNLFQLAEYDVPAIIETYKKLRRGGRDLESVQSHPFAFTCSNLITHAVENITRKPLFKHHWSQTSPEDLWRLYVEKGF